MAPKEFLDGKLPFGKKARQNLIQTHERKIARVTSQGKLGIRARFSYTNSSLEAGGSLLDFPFAKAFEGVLPEGERSLRHYIEGILAHRKGEAIAIEFGGPGSQLFEGFSRDFFAKTAGVTLTDTHILSDQKNKNINSDHKVISGDILRPETYEVVSAWLEDQKLDLIIERMVAGWRLIPKEPYLLSRVLQTWYSLLREGGIMFIEIPEEFNLLLSPWADMLRTQYNQKLEIQTAIGALSKHGRLIRRKQINTVFRLRKLSGAPSILPFLDPRAMREISRKML
jgi:hypothetical protein